MPPRKRKRRALEAHLGFGGPDFELAMAAAASAGDESMGPSEGGDDNGHEHNDEGKGEGVSAVEGEEGEAVVAKQEEENEEPTTRPKEEVKQRRRVLRTSWRMAAISQFSTMFPMLSLREFSIDALERDLEGTDEYSYAPEMISRLLYTLTRDSTLARGPTEEKPWLSRLRREFIRRDPEHNCLGDEPPADLVNEEDTSKSEDGEGNANAAGGDVAMQMETDAKPVISSDVLATSMTSTKDDLDANATSNATAVKDGLPKSEVKEAQETSKGGSDVVGEATVAAAGKPADEVQNTGHPDNEAEAKLGVNGETSYTSRGWEDLTLEEQINALWSICEWHMTNADKLRNTLAKSKADDDPFAWRILPLGADAEHNVYWLFDDNRLWIERETLYTRESRILTQAAERRKEARQEAIERRIKRDQRRRMKQLHENRREKTRLRKAAEERLKAEEAAEEREEAGPNSGRGKRKRRAVSEDEEEEEVQAIPTTYEAEDTEFDDYEDADVSASLNLRASSRLSRARVSGRLAAQAPRRRSMRNNGEIPKAIPPPPTRSSKSRKVAVQRETDNEDDWQKIPPEWLKTEDQEMKEDPDFGGTAAGLDDDDDLESVASDLSALEEANHSTGRPSRSASRRRVATRSSPRRKVRPTRNGNLPNSQSDKPVEESELSDLSAEEDEEEEDLDGQDQGEADGVEEGGPFPESAYDIGPGFDDEDRDFPEGFVRWEAICTTAKEWQTFVTNFETKANESGETGLMEYIRDIVYPNVQASYDAVAAEIARKEAIIEAAERKAKLAAEKEREKREGSSASSQLQKEAALAHLARGGRQRSSRIAMKESQAEEERRNRERALAVERTRNIEQDASEASVKAEEPKVDSRAERARLREEERQRREQQELLDLAAQMEAEKRAELGLPPEDTTAEVLAPDTTGEQQQTGLSMSGPALQPGQALQDMIPPAGEVSLQLESEGAAGEAENAVEEEKADDDSYYLDCSICHRRGTNLDSTMSLVKCDSCDRWEHVRCHNRADAAAGNPKRNFDEDQFICEDCEGLPEGTRLLEHAPKRERSDKQKEGAKKGAAKRKAKFAERRKSKGLPPLESPKGASNATTASIPTAVVAKGTDSPSASAGEKPKKVAKPRNRKKTGAQSSPAGAGPTEGTPGAAQTGQQLTGQTGQSPSPMLSQPNYHRYPNQQMPQIPYYHQQQSQSDTTVLPGGSNIPSMPFAQMMQMQMQMNKSSLPSQVGSQSPLSLPPGLANLDIPAPSYQQPVQASGSGAQEDDQSFEQSTQPFILPERSLTSRASPAQLPGSINGAGYHVAEQSGISSNINVPSRVPPPPVSASSLNLPPTSSNPEASNIVVDPALTADPPHQPALPESIPILPPLFKTDLETDKTKVPLPNFLQDQQDQIAIQQGGSGQNEKTGEGTGASIGESSTAQSLENVAIPGL